MAFVKLWVHAVWTTKDRKPLMVKEIRYDIFNHILENSRNKDIYIDFINGYFEHVHCLISLKSTQNLDKIIGLLKGESSYWINKNKLMRTKFEWQDEYFGVSVGESIVNRVRNYIINQEDHHRKKSFQEEYDEFMRIYGFEKFVQG